MKQPSHARAATTKHVILFPAARTLEQKVAWLQLLEDTAATPCTRSRLNVLSLGTINLISNRAMGTPPPLAFIDVYLSAREVFGQTMDAAFLVDRVRSYGWKPSVTRLAQLAAYVQHTSRTQEQIRVRTVDPILSITGDRSVANLVARAHAFVRANRQRMRIAHEEVITYLQHLVLVEGGDGNEEPTDAELALWMLGANCHLGEWAEEDGRELSLDDQFIAIQVRGHAFNQHRNWSALAVRSYELFRSCPEDESLGGHESW